MKKNIGTADRLLRLTMAIILLALAWWLYSWLLVAAGLFTLYEAGAGWCIFYQLIGKNTCPIEPINARAKSMPNHKTEGVDLYYEIHGQGKPLVLIAGLACHSQMWRPLLSFLSKQYQVIILDNRDSGRSPSPDIAYTVEDMANDVSRLIDHLQLHKPHMLGHSLGGAIAQSLAYKWPEMVDKLILCCTSAKFSKKCHLKEDFMTYLAENKIPRERQAECILPWLYSNHFLDNEENLVNAKRQIVADPYPQTLSSFKRQVNALESFNSKTWLNKIIHPTLIMRGDEDILCLNDNKLLEKEIKNNQSIIFSPSGHIPFAEHSEEFLKQVMAFLQ